MAPPASSYRKTTCKSKHGLPAGEPFSSPSSQKGFFISPSIAPVSRELREQIVARFKTPSIEPFNILTHIGRDCIGAVQLLPSNPVLPTTKQIDAHTFSRQQRRSALANHQ
nr:HipA N-terminal domain-containing protein [Pseudidiomarina sediminum]